MALTVKRVGKLLREGTAGRHTDRGGDGVKGLYLCIKNQANASWALRYQLAHASHWMGLGSARDISLAQAREKAKAQRVKLTEKVDPLATRRAEQAARALAAIKQITFSEAAKQYIAAHEKGWKNPRHREQWSQTLRQYALPKIGGLPVNAVDTPAVLRVLENRDGFAPARSYREHSRLGDSAWLSFRRQSGQMERPSLRSTAETQQGRAARTLCGNALCGRASAGGEAASEQPGVGAGIAVPYPDGGAQQ